MVYREWEKMGKRVQHELMKRLTQLGEDAMNYAFEQGFNEAWILSGEGEMLKSTPPADNLSMSRLLSLLEASHETIRKRDEQIDRLITLLEKETERTEFINKNAV